MPEQAVATGAERKHGVTPGMAHMYAERTAPQQAVFLLPYLTPGMRVLDCGCGPGSITVGLAKAVAPGEVVGIDHDDLHIETARALAAERGVANVSFQPGDIYQLPFEDETFDAVYENAVFIHLKDRDHAAREIYRVLKPGGLFAARDTEMDGLYMSNMTPSIQRGQKLFRRWQRHRGSDLRTGKNLPAILRHAGFERIVPSASYEIFRGEQEADGRGMAALFTESPLTRVALERGWVDRATLDRIAADWLAWAEKPDSYLANAMGEAIGWKQEA